MKTLLTLFAGGGLADVGFRAAGYVPVGAVEYDPDIAAVYHDNHGLEPIIGRVQEVSYRQWAGVDHLHASPICTNASVANQQAGETQGDLTQAEAVVRALEQAAPQTCSVENVWGYRKFQAFGIILRGLERLGYGVRVEHINSADLGVPQTRQRLILRAALSGRPAPLPLSHDQHEKRFWDGRLAVPRWNGWYAAIEDLLPGLPESQLAPWQLARMPEEWRTCLVDGGTPNRPEPTLRGSDEPALSVLVAEGRGPLRAVLVNNGNPSRNGPVHHGMDDPSVTVLAQMDRVPLRALLVSNAATEYSDGLREEKEPALAVTGESGGRVRALLVSGSGTGDSDRTPQLAGVDEARFVNSGKGRPSALLVHPTDMRTMPTREGDEPCFTVTVAGAAADHRSAGFNPRALVGVRCVKLSPRCLARFQSVPDSYRLPAKTELACRIIGGGVPCFLAQRIGESFD